MADEEKKEAPEGAEASDESSEAEGKKGKKKGIFLGGGILGLIAAAYIVSMVALPKTSAPPPFDGPYLVDLSSEDIQVNLRGDGGRRYLVMTLRAEYEGYDEAYAQTRTADLVYQAKLQDVLIGLARQKTIEDIAGRIGEEAMLEEIREAIDPLLFPVHVGNELSGTKPHEESGLRAGPSIQAATMRGGFKAHVIHVDQLEGTIALDEGPAVEFDGTETDLMLQTKDGATVFVDTTGITEEFVGDVSVGTFGRILQVLKGRFITQ